MALRHERIGPLPEGVDRPATATSPAGAELRERVLDVHELVWVLRGGATVSARGGVARGNDVRPRETLWPGDVLLLPAGAAHAFEWGPPGGLVGSVHGYVHADLRGVTPAPGLVVTRAAGGDDPLAGLCAYLLWLGVREPAGWRARAAGVAAVVADLVARGPLPGAEPRDRYPAVVEALVTELRDRWGAGPPLPPARVAELAATVHVSPTHLTRTVRRVWGRSLSLALEQLRVTRVELLLTGTSATIASIARLCGYADAFHCSRRFTAAHGLPPARYRLAAVRPSLLDDPVIRALADAIWGSARRDV